jgi:hypothetical protein
MIKKSKKNSIMYRKETVLSEAKIDIGVLMKDLGRK